MQSKVLAEGHVSIIRVEDGHLRANHVNDEWICPLCTSDREAVYLREESANEHIEQTHLKSKVPYGGYIIAKCGLQCDPDKKKFHYHCVECGRIIFSRGDFFYHLKAHEAQKGLKSRRGRKKGYASLAQSLGQTELFSSVAVVLSPQMMGLLPEGKEEFLVTLQTKTGVNCTVNEENIYVLTGSWSSILQARAMLEELAVRKLELEKERDTAASASAASASAAPTEYAAALASMAPLPLATTSAAPMAATFVDPPASAGSDVNDDVVSETDDEPEEDDGEFEPDEMSSLSAAGSSRHYSSRRRSSRKRKLNRNYDDYVLPSKISKDDEDLPANTSEALNSSQTGDGDYVVNVIISNMGNGAADGDQQALDPTMAEPDPAELPCGSDVEVELDEGVYICQWCGETLAGRLQYDDHRLSRLCREAIPEAQTSDQEPMGDGVEPKQGISCGDCDSRPFKAFDLKMHRMRIHDAPRYECSICHRKFGPLYDLRVHMKYTGHGTGERAMRQTEQCHICNKFIQAKNLKQHVLQVHEKQKPFQCEICGKAFGTRYLVREHMESHKDKEERPRPFRCETCGQGFYKKLPLDEHMTKHQGKPQYQCELCGKQFFHSSGHKRHLQHHSSERNFHCQSCGKSFKTSTNLSAHKAVHKPQTYPCGCGKTYQQRHTLKTHQDKCQVHASYVANQAPEEQLQQPQRYMCGYCQETFGDFGAVQEHLVTHYEDGTTVTAMSAADGSGMQVEATEIDASTLQQLAAAAAAEVDGVSGMIVDSTGGTGHIIGASSLVQLALTAAAASGIDASELDAAGTVHIMPSGVVVTDNEISKHTLDDEAVAAAAVDGSGNLVDMMVLPTS